jgi:hypothetical protein
MLLLASRIMILQCKQSVSLYFLLFLSLLLLLCYLPVILSSIFSMLLYRLFSMLFISFMTLSLFYQIKPRLFLMMIISLDLLWFILISLKFSSGYLNYWTGYKKLKKKIDYSSYIHIHIQIFIYYYYNNNNYLKFNLIYQLDFKYQIRYNFK